MTLLIDIERVAVWANYVRRLCNEEKDPAGHLDLIRDAVNTADQWAEDYSASFNSTLPAEFQAWTTPAEKALLLMYVIDRRYRTSA